MFMELVFPVIALGVMGLLFGLMLGGASKIDVYKRQPLTHEEVIAAGEHATEKSVALLTRIIEKIENR